MSYVELKNVRKEIKGNLILDDINLVFEKGNIYGLRGKNGCGKTMLMRMITGLIFPTSGEVYVDGKKLHKDIALPPSLGALIENPSFLPEYSGLKNLQLLAGLSGGRPEEEIRKSMLSVGLDPNENKAYRKYSLGMKQKLGIANAIMGEPDLIILDEPINALDEESVVKIREELRRLRDLQKLIIVACHDREELNYISDTVIMMKEGRVVGSERIEHEKF